MTRRHEVLTHVVEAIAEVDGCSPHNLGYSLSDHIAVEALLQLVASDHTDWQLTFSVPEHTVEIRGSGQIRVDDTVLRDFQSQRSEV